MALVEREREVKLLDMLHQEFLQGHGAAVAVSGPVASGKTGSRTERSLPFAVMAQIFQPVADVPECTDQVAKVIDLNRCANVSANAPGRACRRRPIRRSRCPER